MEFPHKKQYYKQAKPILVAVDCIIFGFNQSTLQLLLFKRKIAPFLGAWSVIGSFVQEQESTSDAAIRVLQEHTGLENIFLDPLALYSDPERDPGARVISQAYFSLIHLEDEALNKVETHQARWFDLKDTPSLMLDHNIMVQDALDKLRTKARYSPIGFELLPEKFTIPQLQLLYEAIYQKELDRRNFRKKILSMGLLDKLDEKDKSGSRKGAFLYQFNAENYQKMVKEGVDFIL
ncbi:NUDIX hydrolase [Lewinella cohaerens]|uniref:NUDIX hydrolase n=1 Tax=Lewinella cohaerens TaxID=70995 RepID=UPI000371BB94|nr:NUDIX domain-containing protein [Lewinella cohaerens]